MANLNLPNPKMMDVAVPANLKVGLHQEEVEKRGWALNCGQTIERLKRADMVLIDLRDEAERERHGVIPGSVHAPYPDLAANVQPGGLLHGLAKASGKRLVFYCAYGERSAMAVQMAQDCGVGQACHIKGGLDAWLKAGGPLSGPGA